MFCIVRRPTVAKLQRIAINDKESMIIDQWPKAATYKEFPNG